MKQLKEGVCDESEVVSLWKHCGLKWEELGVKGEGIKDLLTKEVSFLCNVGCLTLQCVSATFSIEARISAT